MQKGPGGSQREGDTSDCVTDCATSGKRTEAETSVRQLTHWESLVQWGTKRVHIFHGEVNPGGAERWNTVRFVLIIKLHNILWIFVFFN